MGCRCNRWRSGENPGSPSKASIDGRTNTVTFASSCRGTRSCAGFGLWTLECLFRSNVIIRRAHKAIQGAREVVRGSKMERSHENSNIKFNFEDRPHDQEKGEAASCGFHMRLFEKNRFHGSHAEHASTRYRKSGDFHFLKKSTATLDFFLVITGRSSRFYENRTGTLLLIYANSHWFEARPCTPYYPPARADRIPATGKVFPGRIPS